VLVERDFRYHDFGNDLCYCVMTQPKNALDTAQEATRASDIACMTTKIA
jgi:hypothetical protein